MEKVAGRVGSVLLAVVVVVRMVLRREALPAATAARMLPRRRRRAERCCIGPGLLALLLLLLLLRRLCRCELVWCVWGVREREEEEGTYGLADDVARQGKCGGGRASVPALVTPRAPPRQPHVGGERRCKLCVRMGGGRRDVWAC